MSDKIKDYISQYHDYGIYLPTRTIALYEDIDEESCARFLKNLAMLEASRSKDNFITIRINSGGGDVDCMITMFKAVRRCESTVKFLVEREASSSASLLVLSGDEIIMDKDAYMMIHIGTEGYGDQHPKSLLAWKAKTDKDEEWCKKVYLDKIKQKKPRFTKLKLEKMLEFDTILSASICLAHNLCDKIEE